MPGLYDASVSGLVRESLQHVWSVVFRDIAGASIPVDVIDAEVTLDQTWRPYVQGAVTAVVPPDQATLDRLDPRRIVTAEVRAGYVLSNGTRDEQLLARLYLSGRSVVRPDDTIRLSLQGQEYLLARALPVAGSTAYDPTWMVADAIQASPTQEVRTAVGFMLADAAQPLLDIGTNVGWDYDNASTQTGWSGARVSSTQDERYGADLHYAGVNLLDVAYDLANLTGCWLRCDETGLWRCTGPENPAPPGAVSAQWLPSRIVRKPPAAAALSVGAGGTIIESDTSFDRDDQWANMVTTHFTWSDDTTGNGRYGFARVTAGPFNVDTVGVVGTTTELTSRGYVTQDTANARAAYALSRKLNQGRTITLSAVGMYWLRPADDVTVQLPLGAQERHSVEAVTYTLHEGRMSLRTVRPDTVSTITLGGA